MIKVPFSISVKILSSKIISCIPIIVFQSGEGL